MYTYRSLWYPNPVNLHHENLLGQCQYLLLKIGIITIVIVSQYMYTYRSLWYPNPVNLHHENLLGQCQYLLLKIGMIVIVIVSQYMYTYRSLWYPRPCEPPTQEPVGTVSVSPIKNRYNSYSYRQSIHVHIPFTLVPQPCEPPP